MVSNLQIEVVRAGADVVLSGRLDSRSAPVARALLHEIIGSGDGDLHLHVADLEIWDASGLGVLVGAQRRARQSGRRIVLAEVPPRELRLLRATRLHRLITLEPAVA